MTLAGATTAEEDTTTCSEGDTTAADTTGGLVEDFLIPVTGLVNFVFAKKLRPT